MASKGIKQYCTSTCKLPDLCTVKTLYTLCILWIYDNYAWIIQVKLAICISKQWYQFS